MATFRPPPDPDPSRSPPPNQSPSTSNPAATSIQDQGSIVFIKRTYQQIIADASIAERNKQIVILKLSKIYNPNDSKYKPLSLENTQLGYFIFEVLKVQQEDILGLDLNTGRYDYRELILKHNADTSSYIDKVHIFKEHRIEVISRNRKKTRVTFKFVPHYVPDEEILNLCIPYGKLVDGIVYNEIMKFNGDEARSFACRGTTRYVDVYLNPGSFFKNFYWLEGPSPCDTGRRITVLHHLQPNQCSNCFNYGIDSNIRDPVGNSFCAGGGKSKVCENMNIKRCKMNDYTRRLEEEDGYISLKNKYLREQAYRFPALPSVNQELSEDYHERLKVWADAKNRDKHSANPSTIIQEEKKR